ncbi:ubiquitin-like small modifier protein 1 [Candidatus Leptofilum sp.]|uniref:ubiquitin-like small modifier protein 1 n=1 Tax=Candidatus Leptofilum sp. TaxID=3241576 RepID=UPI003B5BDC8E
MKVNFFATLRPIVGQKTVEIDLPENTTVQQFVEMVVTEYPPMRKELLDEDGNLYRHVHVFVNGRDAPFLENGMDTVIQSEDTLNIFPAVGGG